MSPQDKDTLKEQILTNAVEIISSEGLQAFSVRNLAERSGYSYPMLYRVFKDQKDLLQHVMLRFRNRVTSAIESELTHSDPIENIQRITGEYCDFFIQYPNIFHLLYQDKSQGIFRHDDDKHNYYAIIKELMADSWRVLSENKAWAQAISEQRFAQLDYLIHGALLLHLDNKLSRNYSYLKDDLQNAISQLLQN